MPIALMQRSPRTVEPVGRTAAGAAVREPA
jgi:hypothetical protein